MNSLWLTILLATIWVPGSQTGTAETIETPTEAEVAEVDRVGKELSATLMARLQNELRAAMQSGGPVRAISVCSERAIDLTREVAASHPGASLKRVTVRSRNPLNSPDQLEADALEQFASMAAAGEPLPARLVQKIRRDGQVTYRFYQPLTTAGLCLVCHGDPDRMPADLRAELNRRYPEDKAIGYEDGDFRGAIRVEIPGD